ncbi:lamin tail domain-containing protein [Halobacterium wangiae]|uniref:lamin tail domain-containing protein n=1 Tax=Halobacterium wangiae TaxID=2902623 RepID=UPI001E2A062D|nr:lamin tail domain-containing protein [Halobacterium wangiae]
MIRKRSFGVLAVVLLVMLAGCTGVLSDQTTPQNTPGITSEPTTTELTGTSTSPTGPDGELSIHFINVGQGSSTLIIGPSNETMLIDSGDWSDDGEDVLKYLQERNIERIDYLVSTHADADHIGGHEAVINYFETQGEGVGAVYDSGIASSSQTYQGYLDTIEEHDVTLYETRAGDTIPFEGVDTRVLAPPEGYLADGDRNENSIVLRLGYGQSSFLLPGDGETACEEYLVEEYGSGLNVTAMSAGHHGSQSSSSSEFLDATTPRVAVISSAYDSQYGHPHESVLERFHEQSIRAYWTATHGNIRIRSTGSTITVATQRQAPTSPLEIRDSDPVEPGLEDELVVRTTIQVSGSVTEETTTTSGTKTTEETLDQDGELSIAGFHADAEGDDAENLNDEYVVFENTGSESLELGGWTVSDSADHTYTFPSGFTLDPGAQVTLHTGSGTDSTSDLYWGAGSAIWNNAGDTIIVESDEGSLVLEEDYE